MKKLFTLLLLAAGTLTAQAQLLPSFSFGLKAGANLSHFSTTNTFSSSNRAGYYGGLWGRVGAAGLHFQPELYISGKQARLTEKATNAAVDVNFTSIDIPLLIGTRLGALGVGVRFNTGPVVSFNINKDQNFKDAGGKIIRGNFKDQNIAWQFGTGLDVRKLGVDLRYEQGITKLNKDGYSDVRLGLFTLGLSYKLY